jgi:CxxC-x17-CxxC domain-containing protein
MLYSFMNPKDPRVARKVRSEHGTRVARQIVCSSCGAKDTIHFAPKDPKRVLCRKCAADLLGIEDPDTRVGSNVSFKCAQCGRAGTTQDKRKAESGDYVCNDCMRGIESRQENKTKTAVRLSKKVVRVRKS